MTTIVSLPNSPDRLQRTGLLVLAVSTFAFVTSETLPIGLLPQIAASTGVSEASVGRLLTSYAAIAAVSTVPLTALTRRIPRRLLMTSLLGVFAAAQILAVLAPSYLVLSLSRVVCALAHGVFWSIVAGIAAQLAPAGLSGRATSLAFIGNSVALVLGLPLGTALGQVAGWRTAFAVTAGIGLISMVALRLVLPRFPAPTPRPTGERAGGVLPLRPVLVVCVMTVILVIGQFAVYTYATAVIADVGGIAGTGLTVLLLGFGILGGLATWASGRVVDRNPGPGLAACTGLIAVALLMLTVGRGAALTTVAVLLWGVGWTAVSVFLQSAMLRIAPNAQEAASAAYVTFFQIGIATGALVGGEFVDAGEIRGLCAAGAATALVITVVVLFGRTVFPFRVPAVRSADGGQAVPAVEDWATPALPH